MLITRMFIRKSRQMRSMMFDGAIDTDAHIDSRRLHTPRFFTITRYELLIIDYATIDTITPLYTSFASLRFDAIYAMLDVAIFDYAVCHGSCRHAADVTSGPGLC